MSQLFDLLEEERHKLNQLGKASLKQAIRLSENLVVQEQSQKVDKLVALVGDIKAKGSRVRLQGMRYLTGRGGKLWIFHHGCSEQLGRG